jgi:alpha-L-arabinofuranosidase
MAGVWNYQMTNGLGIIEYLEWCEDMNLEPSMPPNFPRIRQQQLTRHSCWCLGWSRP